MALITISGQPGCHEEEVARLTAQRLGFELITQSRIDALIEREFGAGEPIPDRAYLYVVLSMLGRLAAGHNLVVCAPGSETMARSFPMPLRVHVVAPESYRVGNLMLDWQVDRPAARKLLAQSEAQQNAERRRRFGRIALPPHLFDLVLNAELLTTDHMADVIEASARSLGLPGQGPLSPAAEAQLQFRVRLKLAKHRIVPPDRVTIQRKTFVHPSEEIFANLLDFYRIAWEYEPRSFPIRWDETGAVAEAFTPDFYLPEFNLYVELTTMKQ